MCGRYNALSADGYDEVYNIVSSISKKFNHSDLAQGEVFPTNNIPVIYSHNGKNILSNAKWGFPGSRSNSVVINARSESITNKAMFRNSFISRRCLIPAKGYYEWLTDDKKKKTKYVISVKDSKILYMAGLYNIFCDDAGTQYAAIVIVTTEAQKEISFIHSRMPVILQPETVSTWLNCDYQNQLQEILISCKNELVYSIV